VTIPFSFDQSTSIAPGWHTSYITPGLFATIVISGVLILNTVLYYVLSKKQIKINSTPFLIHQFLTLPTVLFIRYPGLLFNLTGLNLSDPSGQIQRMSQIIYVAYILFSIGQLMFLVKFLMMVRKLNQG
jgi:hypothetical protein